MVDFVNSAIYISATKGTAPFTVAGAARGYQTPAAAGATDGLSYRYRAQNAALTEWEEGTAVASNGATQFTRVVLTSSGGPGATVDFTSPPTVALTIFAEDILAETAAVAANAAAALVSENNAATSADNAATSETNSAASAAASSSSASTSSTEAAAALVSETSAAASATSATASEAASSTSETNAATSETNAAGSASSAAGSASAASTSASNAATSETGSAASASAASGSASSAAASASAASTSETNAAASASAASTSETNAASSATAASGSASTASTQASNAAASAAAASTSETNAATSETAAAGSATAAASSATAAASSLVSFTGVYYGAFATDPTLDPNGNALNAGDLYWSTSSSILKIYDGTAWGGYTASGAPIASPIFTGSVDVTATGGYKLGGVTTLVESGGYVQIFNSDGVHVMELGYSADKTNYYENDAHAFYDYASLVLFGTLDATGFTLPAGKNFFGAVAGGTGAASSLVLESTSGAGTSDNILFKTGSQLERMRIRSDGRVTQGAAYDFGYARELHTNTTTGRLMQDAHIYWGTSGDWAGRTQYTVPSGTIGTLAANANNSGLGGFDAGGSDGTSIIVSGGFDLMVDGPVSAGILPSRLAFLTTDTAGSIHENLRIDNAGRIGLGMRLSLTGGSIPNRFVIRDASSGTSQFIVDSYGSGTASNNNLFMALNNFNADGFGDGLNLTYSRGTLSSPAIVQSGDLLGQVVFQGGDGTSTRNAAAIKANVDGTPGSGDMPGRIALFTAPDGTATLTERMRINNAGAVHFPSLGTTASAANAFINNASSPANSLLRSTSSLRYKQNVEPVGQAYVDAALAIRPIWYRSKAKADNPSWSFYGYGAEDVAAIDPRLVHWAYLDEDYDEVIEHDAIVRKLKPGSQLVPDAVMYDRVAILQIAALYAKVTALEAKVAALSPTAP